HPAGLLIGSTVTMPNCSAFQPVRIIVICVETFTGSSSTRGGPCGSGTVEGSATAGAQTPMTMTSNRPQASHGMVTPPLLALPLFAFNPGFAGQIAPSYPRWQG